MLQAVIARMGGNLFILKGWSITLIVALIAIIGKDLNARNVVLSFAVLFIFWILDGYFLSLERCYRSLYDQVRANPQNEADFSMEIKNTLNGRNTWFRSMFSKTLLIFYGSIFIAMMTLIALYGVRNIHASIEINNIGAEEAIVH